jgi:hypothetical protein
MVLELEFGVEVFEKVLRELRYLDGYIIWSLARTWSLPLARVCTSSMHVIFCGYVDESINMMRGGRKHRRNAWQNS